MAMISTFSTFVLFFITAHVTSALNPPVLIVRTVSSVTLISGMEATLRCNYNRTVFAVYWRYESTRSPMELLVVLDKHYEEGKRSGPGYDEKRFDITDDYSLIIHDVQATDEGKYICEVSDFETGSVLRNHTDVTTVVLAERPFVRIEQCEEEVSADRISESSCPLRMTSDDPNIELTCTVLGAKPLATLSWTSSLSSDYWKQVMNESTLTNKERGNGIFDQTLTVIVDTSHTKSNTQHFTCVAKGLAVDGVASDTIAVYHAQGSNVTRTVVAVVIVVCTLLFTFVVIGVWWKVRDKRPSQTGTLEEKIINRIKNMKADEPVYLGVFGDEGAGKSSFIDSIKHLIKGKDGLAAPKSSRRTHANSSMWEYTEFISKGLQIRKQRDDKAMITPEEMSAILMSKKEDNPSSRSHGMIMESSNLIHYPIFVFDISNKHDGDNRMELLRKLAEAVHHHILQYPMIVLTKASTTRKGPDEEELIRELIRKTKIPRENILVTFQFSTSKDKIDEHTRIEQLDFILKCVDKVDAQKKDIKKDIEEPLSEEEKSETPLLNDTTV